MLNSNQPLRVKIQNGRVVISIGLELLAQVCPETYCPLKITDLKEFGKTVVSELTREKEDGTTVVHEMFDKALMSAIENGEEGFDIDALDDLWNDPNRWF